MFYILQSINILTSFFCLGYVIVSTLFCRKLLPTEPGNQEKAGNSKIITPCQEKTLNLTWYGKKLEITGKTVSAI